jgi:DNA ligase-1
MTDHTKFKPMLAKAPDSAEKIKYPVLAQHKIDGIRATVVNGRLVSRTLKLIPNAEIQEALAHPEFEGLDGELIVGPPTAEDCYRRTTSFVMSESKTGADWAFYVFDKWNEPGGFEERHAAAALVAQTIRTSGDIVPVPYRVVNDAEELAGIEASLLAEGHEGVIVRVPGSAYKFGRSGKTGPLLKVKSFIDFECEVVGVYEENHNGNVAKRNELGRTERSSAKAGKVGKGTLGGLVLVAINGPSEGIEFRCGTGFSADERADLWQNQDLVVGSVAKVKSFPIGVKDKPRHPVYLGLRDMAVDGGG